MKLKLINPCNAPSCQAGATHVICLDNNKCVAKVCERHIAWGKERAQKIENGVPISKLKTSPSS